MTAAADVYSLGCVLYEMLTGQLPFTGSTPDLVLKHMRETPRPPSYHLPSLSPEVDELILSLLQKEPTDRPKAFDLAESLAAIWERLRSTMAPPPNTALPPTNPPAALPQVVGTAEEEERWTERVDRLDELLRRAHPRGDVPREHLTAVEELRKRVRGLASLRRQLDQRLTLTEAQGSERDRPRRRCASSSRA